MQFWDGIMARECALLSFFWIVLVLKVALMVFDLRLLGMVLSSWILVVGGVLPLTCYFLDIHEPSLLHPTTVDPACQLV